MATCDVVRKKCHVIFKIFFAFQKIFKLLGMCAKFRVNSSSLSKKSVCVWVRACVRVCVCVCVCVCVEIGLKVHTVTCSYCKSFA